VSDTEIKSRILEAAREYYFENGFSKSTMDDFAHNLGMSKKTIYKYFQSKDDIVREITREKIARIHSRCMKLRSDSSIDFVERIRCVTQFLSNEMRKFKPVFYLDLQRTMPDMWKEIDEFRRKRILEDFKKLIVEGVETGVFRSDVNVDVLVMMYASAMQTIVNPETLSTLPLNAAQAYEAIVDIIFGGIFTKEAKEKYKCASNVNTITVEKNQPGEASAQPDIFTTSKQ